MAILLANIRSNIVKAFLNNKELHFDTDSKFWWLDGMIVSFVLSIEDVLYLKHDKCAAIKRCVVKEFGDTNGLTFSK
ncbi:hypothetical protein [Alishewanella phage vB_AspM_Slicko01]|nr:hypothetical protein [Alishewanella phage vB_AspM_Slicko01]